MVVPTRMPGLVLGLGGSVPEITASPHFGLGLCSGCLSLADYIASSQTLDISLVLGKELGLWNQTDEAQI